MNQIQKEYNNFVSILPVNQSKSAFLVEGLEFLDSKYKKPYHVDEWDFSTSHVVGVRYALTLSFFSVKAEYVRGIQDALYKFYHHSKKHNTLPLSVNQMTTMKVALQRVSECLGSTNWSDLDNIRCWKKFLRDIKNKKYSQAAIGQVISSLNKLTAIGEIDLYVDAMALRKCASCKTSQQHVAIPHRLYTKIMNHALLVIEKYHPYRHEISRVMSEAYALKKRVELGEIVIVPKRKRLGELNMSKSAISSRIKNAMKTIEHNIPDFKVDLRAGGLIDILASCIAIVQGFSGVRIGEAMSFTKSSAKEIVVNGRAVTVLRGETSKAHDGIPKITTWQTHNVAKTALELAYDMMESTRVFYSEAVDQKEAKGESSELIQHMRKQLKSAFLVPKAGRQSGSNYILEPHHVLKKLIKSVDYKATLEDVDEFNVLNPTREGELKVGGTYDGLSSHDFRRTFAVFFVRYGFGSASGIKFQFKHQNINMSDYYANNAILAQMNDILMDEDLLDELKESGIDLGIDIYDEIYNESKRLSGAKGEEIMQDRMRRLQAGEGIIMTREEIEENIRRGNFHIMQLPSGAYCTNGTCDRVCGTQPFRAEIKECEHKVVTDRGAKMVARQRERLIAKFCSLNDGDSLKSSILCGLKQKIQVEELTLKAHEIPYMPFNDDIILNSVT
ncbi:hypothetical protein M5219_002386 [Vibrio vulnificus]|nr:hypothetical protein [Vibrio vulnificus]